MPDSAKAFAPTVPQHAGIRTVSALTPAKADTSISVAPEPSGEIKYFDQYGNEISEEESRRRELKDKNGAVICEYIQRNDNVCRLHYSAQDGTVLPITVSTYDDLYEARAKAEVRNAIFAVAYCAECVLVLVFYFIKRKR